MNYLISKFGGTIVDDETNVFPNVKYVVENVEKAFLFSSTKSEVVQYINLNKNQPQVLTIKHNGNNYFILDCFDSRKFESVSFEFEKHKVSVSISSRLFITINGEVVLNTYVENIEYSSYEFFENVCLIYFKGERNYVVVVQGLELISAMYYDECNIQAEEKYFMCKLKDCLNHGKVIHIKDKKVENYLVYLDDYDLNLKPQFIAHAFLDCVKAGNFKYCNNLLCEELKQECEDNIKEFFPDFDIYYELEENTFALIKKNTLAGIYKFEIENCLIVNVFNC